MKNQSLKDKFKNNILVRPLYRKVQKVRPNLIAINVDNTYKLEGNDFKVKRHISSDVNGEIVTVNSRKLHYLPGECENVQKLYKNIVETKSVAYPFSLSGSQLKFPMIARVENEVQNVNIENNSAMMTDKLVQAQRLVVLKNIPDTWLRVYPLPALPKESACSIILRCIFCQIGLATIIVLWTIIWTIAIHSFEGPYEIEVTENFEKEQNQLVIDLATELRQITPIAEAWRNAIEKRIEQERQLTIVAVSRGAQIHTGQFWDLPGTFLFSVYVMTALGFGAPVPHTPWGRSSALIYAVVAVPAHIYLLMNASKCLIANVEACCSCRKKKILNYEKTSGNKTESPNCSRNSEFMKTSNGSLRRKLLRVLCVPCAGHCVPLAMTVYYAIGAVSFGVLRDLPLDEIFMFPVEFTTTGGLELVDGYVRVLYGIYIEGAMALLSCALAILRRNSSGTINSVAESYRLFQVEDPSSAAKT